MKVVVTSDNHGIDCLNDIAMLHNDASYFFHCGDSLMMEKELGEYISVRGNCDYDHDLPLSQTWLKAMDVTSSFSVIRISSAMMRSMV